VIWSAISLLTKISQLYFFLQGWCTHDACRWQGGRSLRNAVAEARWPNSACFSCGLPKIWFRIISKTQNSWRYQDLVIVLPSKHTQHLFSAAYSQHSTSHHITFFAFERFVLFSVYLYQKDERTEPWGLQSDKFSVSLLITVINAIATGWTVRGCSFSIPRFRLSFPLCCSC
jgi:hypothetical protein